CLASAAAHSPPSPSSSADSPSRRPSPSSIVPSRKPFLTAPAKTVTNASLYFKSSITSNCCIFRRMAEQIDGNAKVRATFNLPRELVEEARDTVVALAGPPHRLTLAKLAEM